MATGRISPLRLLAIETRALIRRRPITPAIGLAALGGAIAWWLPRFPEGVFRFFKTILHMRNWTEIVIINNYTGLYFFLFWIGVFEVLRICVRPREERYLELYLSKPVDRRTFMLAKIGPVLAALTLIGALAAAAHGGAMHALGMPIDWPAYRGASAVVVGLTVCLVAVVNLLVVHAHDSHSALLIAFVPGLAAMAPGLVYVYRPDVYEAAPGLADAIVFPGNLIWHSVWAARWGPPLGAACLFLAGLLAFLAGERLRRSED